MTRAALAAMALTLTIGSAAHANGVVINEVMYRPYNQSTWGRHEFVELYNAGDTAVDLSGALLTDFMNADAACLPNLPMGEGVYEIPNGTVIEAGAFLVLWRNHIPGVTDVPGNLVYDHFVNFGSIVLNDGGDEVTLMRCSGETAVIIDRLDYRALGLGDGLYNFSIERINPNGPTQDVYNWEFSAAPPGYPDPNGGYTRGGTPGGPSSFN